MKPGPTENEKITKFVNCIYLQHSGGKTHKYILPLKACMFNLSTFPNAKLCVRITKLIKLNKSFARALDIEALVQ